MKKFELTGGNVLTMEMIEDAFARAVEADRVTVVDMYKNLLYIWSDKGSLKKKLDPRCG